jgi:Bacterial Ig domain
MSDAFLSLQAAGGSPQSGGAPTGALLAGADGNQYAADCVTCTNNPDANYYGTDSFSYQLNDGTLYSNTASVSLGIASVNDAPTGANNTVTTLEDTPYIFQAADFGFSDAAEKTIL